MSIDLRYKIYKVTLKGTDKCYIGFTRDTKKRFKEHRTGNRSGVHLQKAIKEYGILSFSFDIIDSSNSAFEAQYVLEPYYIGRYKADTDGFNGSIRLARPLYYGTMSTVYAKLFHKHRNK